jgi:hypothetical protein
MDPAWYPMVRRYGQTNCSEIDRGVGSLVMGDFQASIFDLRPSIFAPTHLVHLFTQHCRQPTRAKRAGGRWLFSPPHLQAWRFLATRHSL